MTKPGYGDYFYLRDSHANPTGHVKTKTLTDDVQRGVKRLAEDAYCPSYGATQTSMRFMNAIINIFGINFVQAEKAELRYSQRKHFTLVVYTINGFEIVFKGVSGGYFGEGTRGCYDILKVCGFSQKQCERAFTNETFRVQRSLIRGAKQ